MTAIIHYKIPYDINGNDSFIISFPLETDVSLRCVFSLATLLSMSATIYLIFGELSRIEFNRKIPLNSNPLGKGLFDRATLNN